MPPFEIAKIVVLVLNPVWATAIGLVVLHLVLQQTGLWRRFGWKILLIPVALYAIDSAIALPRVLFSYGLKDQPVISKTIPLPRQLVLVDIPCAEKCHELLISGAVEEVIMTNYRSAPRAERQVIRARAAWTKLGVCPADREMAMQGFSRSKLLAQGYCPQVEPAELPSQGVFLIHEFVNVLAKEHARPFAPAYLVKKPPGKVIRFFGVEVQSRDTSGTRVIASSYEYRAPGLLGLPPLIGCWHRPDNILWIMPPGDTGCGLWRLFTWGGDEKANSDAQWVFDRAFGPPDRDVIAPQKPEFAAPTPAEVIEILLNFGVENYLPRLKTILL